jgi:hypothetical protein
VLGGQQAVRLAAAEIEVQRARQWWKSILPVAELMTDFVPIPLLGEDVPLASCARNALQ